MADLHFEDPAVGHDDHDDLFSDDEWDNPYETLLTLPDDSNGGPDSVVPPTEHTSEVQTVSTTRFICHLPQISSAAGPSVDNGVDDDELEQLWHEVSVDEQVINQQGNLDDSVIDPTLVILEEITRRQELGNQQPFTDGALQVAPEQVSPNLDISTPESGPSRQFADCQDQQPFLSDAFFDEYFRLDVSDPVPSVPLPSCPITESPVLPPAGVISQVTSNLNSRSPPVARLDASSVTLPTSPLPNPTLPSSPLATAYGQDENFIVLSDIQGFFLCQTETRRHIRVPRRIDLDRAVANEVIEHVTFKRETKLEYLVLQDLELSKRQQKQMRKSLALYLNQQHPQWVARGGKPTQNAVQIKYFVRDLAYELLVAQGWGPQWFGPQIQATTARERVWPFDSTFIFLYFCRLIHRQMELTTAANRKLTSGSSESSSPGASFSSPEPVSGRNSPSLQSTASPATASPAPSRRPLRGSALSNLVRSTPEPVLHDNSTPRLGSPAVASPLATAVPSAQYLDRPASSPTVPSSPSVPAVPLPARSPIAEPAWATAESRKRKYGDFSAGGSQFQLFKPPPTANLFYLVEVRFLSTGILLESREHKHTDPAVANGLFTHIKAFYEATGYQPCFQIRTAQGLKTVTDQQSWDSEVSAIYYSQRRAVEIEVYI
ncbi:hypothetical protein QBC38DRAFT_443466 [Podospora fimiseda]|uniref:Uncharacterized protein n=1 Tax=Podospora fimiseda TaxID=252190 RepID=A0AAN7BRD4_9PEZI|nr:hypothetical protein QBC38DRAFT_443466 [Podospora fimiseda]